MPRGDKSSYSGKQKRQAEHIEKGYEKRGVGKKTAKARAWATVNKSSGGGKKSGSGRGKATSKSRGKVGERAATPEPGRKVERRRGAGPGAVRENVPQWKNANRAGPSRVAQASRLNIFHRSLIRLRWRP